MMFSVKKYLKTKKWQMVLSCFRQMTEMSQWKKQKYEHAKYNILVV